MKERIEVTPRAVHKRFQGGWNIHSVFACYDDHVRSGECDAVEACGCLCHDAERHEASTASGVHDIDEEAAA